MLFKESIKRFTPPKGWGWASISDVAKLSFSSVDKKSVEGEKAVRLCNYMDVFYNRRIREGMPFMASTASDSDIKKFTLNKEDVVLTKDSETPEEIAFAAVIDEQIDNLVCGYHLAVLRPDKAKVTGEYLMFAINFHPNHHQFVRLANGATRFGLGIDSLNNALIPLPPLAEQRKIAEILRTWDEAIETAEAELKAKQERKRWLMENLMKSSAEGVGVVNASKAKVMSAGLKEVADFFADGDWIESKDQSPSGFRLVQTGNIGVGRYLEHPGRARYVSADTFKRLNCTQLKAGDMLISRLPDPVGRACLFPGGFDAITAVDCTIVRVNQRVVLPAWVHYFAQTQQYQKQVDAMIGGSTRLRITRKELGAIQVPLPSLAEQRKIAEILDSADAAIESSDERIEALRKQKRGLMQKLLTGEVRVAA
jgi:type I restriction enzyme S subunit